MQWFPLPSSPLLPYERDRSWAALICEEPYHYDKEQGMITRLNVGYRFRVVVVHPFPRKEDAMKYDPFANFNLVVFCSETGQWKQVILVIPTAGTYQLRDTWAGFDGVVRNRMLYLRYNLMFGSFDPFNVTAASNGPLVATSLPSPNYGMGSLHDYKGRVLSLAFDQLRSLLIEELKPENKELPVRWQLIEAMMFDAAPSRHYFRVLGVNPMDKKLVYLIATVNNRVLLCDMRSPRLNPLNFGVPSYHLSAF